MEKEKEKNYRITGILILINVIVFLLIFSMPESMQAAVFESFSFSGANSLEIWRWITSLFLHVSASHLFFNMLGLYFFGRILEDEIPAQWFVAVYFIAGLLGNFVFMFSSPAAVVGASGAMFGIMGAAMLLNPIKKVYIYVFPLPLGIIAITFIVFETMVVYFQPAEFANVANVSHVAGIITGSFFAFFHNPKKSAKGSLVLIISLLLIIVLGPIFALITGIGGIILGAIDWIIGLVLYTLANILSFIWA
jgi:membrane associated rhomboid family serine protease